MATSIINIFPEIGDMEKQRPYGARYMMQTAGTYKITIPTNAGFFAYISRLNTTSNANDGVYVGQAYENNGTIGGHIATIKESSQATVTVSGRELTIVTTTSWMNLSIIYYQSYTAINPET